MVNDALTELFPVINVENLPGELYFLSGTKLAHGGAVQTGAGGQFAQINLVNPVGSGHLITITSVAFSNAVASNMLFAAGPEVVNTDAGTATFRDTRTGVLGAVGRVDQASAVAAVPAILPLRILGNNTYRLDDRNGLAVLSPGNMYQVGTEVAAQTIRVAFWWRERPAEQSELNF